MRKKLYHVIESNDIYSGCMMVLIVLSIVPLAFKQETPLLETIDEVCAYVFLIDYILRWITADYKLRSRLAFVQYPITFMALIDLASILPSFTVLNRSFKVLRMLRLFRALRVLRMFKMARYSRSIRIISQVFQKSKDALAAVGTLAVVYILGSALIVINVEPDTFDTFFDAVYWATISLTTMGYGDIYPVTTAGRLVTMLSSVFGIAIVALPAGIITAGYMTEIEKEEHNNGESRI